VPDPVPHGRARPGAAAQVAGVVAFPLIGGGLAVSGMPVGDVLTLVSGCGAIGAAAVALASGRLPGAPVAGRLAGALAAVVRSALEPRP
jgi:hypothetical protein